MDEEHAEVESTPITPDTIRPELLEKFTPQFEACLSLSDHLRTQRPSGPPTDDVAGHLILWTFARSTKTFQAAVRLAGLGYGEQAGMVNRSLYEDMLIAHWVKRHPEEAPVRFNEHEKYTLAQWRNALERNDLLKPDAHFPTKLTPHERKTLNARYRGKTWTGLNLVELLNDVRAEWPNPEDARLLNQISDIVHRFNNLLLHHTARGLAVTGRWDEASNSITFDVGPSTRHIHGALLGAFFPYANTASLLDKDDSIGDLYQRGIAAFLTERPRTSQASACGPVRHGSKPGVDRSGPAATARAQAAFGFLPRRACLVPFPASSPTSLAFTSRTTWPRRASLYLIVTVAASFSSISLPVRSLTKIVLRATNAPSGWWMRFPDAIRCGG
jgi:hypothetical protein